MYHVDGLQGLESVPVVAWRSGPAAINRSTQHGMPTTPAMSCGVSSRRRQQHRSARRGGGPERCSVYTRQAKDGRVAGAGCADRGALWESERHFVGARRLFLSTRHGRRMWGDGKSVLVRCANLFAAAEWPGGVYVKTFDEQSGEYRVVPGGLFSEEAIRRW